MCNTTASLSARKNAINLLKNSITESDWNRNDKQLASLRKEILEHPLFKHQIIKKLKSNAFNLNQIQDIHLEYQHSIVEIFTDALLMAQFQARQLDSKMFPTIKMLPRFLIAFNINDEFGLSSENNTYENTPLNAHFCLFNKVLDDLEIPKERIENFNFSQEADNVRNFLEGTYSDYVKVILALAIAEQQVITFSPPLKTAVHNLNINTSKGYYDVHGTTEDETISAADDLHEEDLWLLLTHCLHLSDFEDVRKVAIDYCNAWYKFWEKMNTI
jgi:hypothetical protein